METINYVPAGPTVERFHQSEAFVRGLMGPVGSSKSTACCVEMFMRACEQPPDGKTRRTRWAVLRNTYPELKSTTIKTWQEWFPFCQMKWDSPISSRIAVTLPDKTWLEMEVYFLALERPEDVGKLKSLELTGAWMNEAGEMAKGVFDMLTQRVGRYPSKKRGGPKWSGVLMDTNPPDDDSWYYKLAEKDTPKGWDFFKQPGGLKEVNGEFVVNPEAENVENLPNGHEYYLRQLGGKSKDWIRVFLCGSYGAIISGKPVYPEYNDDIHCKAVKPYPKVPLILGFDFGLTPACSICQLSPRGQFVVLDELVALDMGIRQFTRDIVIPHLSMNYAGMTFQGVGDPSGMSRKDTDEKTCFMELAELGIPCVPASSNNFTARREAVAKYLTKMIDGQPGFLIDPKADMNRRGHRGRYQFNRVQVSGERFRDVPDKNDASHPCEATQYAALYSLTMNNNEFWSKKIEYKNLGIV